MRFVAALVAAATVLVLAVAGAGLVAPPRMAAPRWPVAGATRASQTPDATTWADLLSALAAEARTGASLAAAFDRATGTLHTDGHAIRRNSTIADLVATSSTNRSVTPDRDEAVVVHAVLTSRSIGGPPAATFDAAAAVLRERAALRAEAAVHSAQARLSARVLTGVPLAFTAWSLLTSHSFREAWHSPIGLTAATLGAFANLCGWQWMRRSIRRATP